MLINPMSQSKPTLARIVKGGRTWLGEETINVAVHIASSYGTDTPVDAVEVASNGAEPLSAGVADLLANLRHLCDAAGIDYDDVDTKAAGDYTAEIYGIY